MAYVNLKGKVKFKKDIEVETAEFDGSSLILKDKDDVRLLSLDGSKDVLATSYYKNINNYLAKMQAIFMDHINLLKMVKKKK